VTVSVSADKMFGTCNKPLCPLPVNHVDLVYGAIQVQTFEQVSEERWAVHLPVLVTTLPSLGENFGSLGGTKFSFRAYKYSSKSLGKISSQAYVLG
jgi:hypothetical protein